MISMRSGWLGNQPTRGANPVGRSEPSQTLRQYWALPVYIKQSLSSTSMGHLGHLPTGPSPWKAECDLPSHGELVAPLC